MKFTLKRAGGAVAAAAVAVLMAFGVGVALPAGADTTPPAGGQVAGRTIGAYMWAGPWVPVGAGGASAAGGVHTDIIGGMPASESYPGMTSLMRRFPQDPDWHTCGASLAFHRWVVTNAHCVTDDNGTALPADLFHIRVGSADRTSGGDTAEVTKVIPHPGWDWGTGVKGADRFYDLALLEVDHYVQVQPFNIPTTRIPNGPVRAIGWGVTEPRIEGPLPFALQELDLRLLPNSKCQGAAEGGADPGELCVSNYGGTDGLCFGDSGSPLLQHVRRPTLWESIGGTSRLTDEGSDGSPHCNGTPPVTTIYTNWTEARNRTWIYEVARLGAAPPWTPERPRPAKMSLGTRPGGGPIDIRPTLGVRRLAVKLPTAPVLPPSPR